MPRCHDCCHLAVHIRMSYAVNKALFPADSPWLAIAPPGGNRLSQ
jgi:hypothetical protein